MARLLVMSDLHLEMRLGWRDLVAKIPEGAADVLVLAGDIVCFDQQRGSVSMLRALTEKAPATVMVLGNHEHWHQDFDQARERAASACAQTGVHLLDADTVTLAGQRFVGGTLWFPEDPLAAPHRHVMTDFHVIGRFEERVYDENRRCADFLASTVCDTDVVITHHLPSRRSVAPQYQSGPASQLNAFFVGDCEGTIARAQPRLWIHGHTHVPFDYAIGATRVLCNPIGYPRESHETGLGLVVDV